MSGTLLVDDVLTLAEAIYLQLRSCRDLPSDVHEILAISSPHSDDNSPFSSALPPATSTTANQQTPNSHVTQSLYSPAVQGLHSEVAVEAGSDGGGLVYTSCGGSGGGGDVTPTNDDSSIEILSESV